MSEAILVALIHGLCATGPTNVKLECYDFYVNCAVRYTGVLTEAEFKQKCYRGVSSESANQRTKNDFKRN